MISILLEFEPIEGMEKEFISAWKECTEVIYENFASLGSRLHRSDKGAFIAYAQWPNEDIYAKSSGWPEHLVPVRDRMRSLLKRGKPTVLHVLKVEVDLLKCITHS
jgi:hypothetical protein